MKKILITLCFLTALAPSFEAEAKLPAWLKGRFTGEKLINFFHQKSVAVAPLERRQFEPITDIKSALSFGAVGWAILDLLPYAVHRTALNMIATDGPTSNNELKRWFPSLLDYDTEDKSDFVNFVDTVMPGCQFTQGSVYIIEQFNHDWQKFDQCFPVDAQEPISQEYRQDGMMVVGYWRATLKKSDLDFTKKTREKIFNSFEGADEVQKAVPDYPLYVVPAVSMFDCSSTLVSEVLTDALKVQREDKANGTYKLTQVQKDIINAAARQLKAWQIVARRNWVIDRATSLASYCAIGWATAKISEKYKLDRFFKYPTSAKHLAQMTAARTAYLGLFIATNKVFGRACGAIKHALQKDPESFQKQLATVKAC